MPGTSGTSALPSVLATIVVLPDELGPKSWVKSTTMVKVLRSSLTVILTFFTMPPFGLTAYAIDLLLHV